LRKALAAVILGVAVYTLIVLSSDLAGVAGAVRGISPAWIPVFLALPLANYMLRFVKWHYFLRRIGARVPPGESLLVFVAGFSMTVSPGKFGEFIKCVILRNRRGLPVARTSPVVVAERITDLISMVALAAVGAVLSGGWSALPAATAGVVFIAGALTVLFWNPAWKVFSGTARRMPFIRERAGSLDSFRRSAKTLLNAGSMLVSVPLGMVGWGVEALVLCAAARSVGAALPVGAALLSHAAGTIAGAVSMIPGGLGLTEITIDGLLGSYMTPARAAVTTLLMRFCTLWFGVFLGLAALGFQKRSACGSLSRSEPSADGTGVQESP
jgi:uncharacterized protein (TIRG00374 family)